MVIGTGLHGSRHMPARRGSCLEMVPRGSSGQQAAFLVTLLLLFDFLKAGVKREGKSEWEMRASSAVCSSASARSLLVQNVETQLRPAEPGSALATSTPSGLGSAGPAVPVPIAVVKVRKEAMGHWAHGDRASGVTSGHCHSPILLNLLLHPPDRSHTFWYL